MTTVVVKALQLLQANSCSPPPPRQYNKHSCSPPPHHRSEIRRQPGHMRLPSDAHWALMAEELSHQRPCSVPLSAPHPRKSPSGNDPICQPEEPGYSQACGLDEDNLYRPPEVYRDVTDTCASHNINNAAVKSRSSTTWRGRGARGAASKWVIFALRRTLMCLML